MVGGLPFVVRVAGHSLVGAYGLGVQQCRGKRAADGPLSRGDQYDDGQPGTGPCICREPARGAQRGAEVARGGCCCHLSSPTTSQLFVITSVS